jgi:hypothetical protein
VHERLRIVVGGYLVRAPLGGQAWHYLQYLIGLASLGHEVLYVEDSRFFVDDEYEWYFDPAVGESGKDPTHGLAFTHEALGRFGLEARWAFYEASADHWHGPAASTAVGFCADADLFLNLSGVNPVRSWLEEIPLRVFVDTDPCFTQIKVLDNPINRGHAMQHNAFATFGENIASGASALPPDIIAWFPTRQPMVLEAWHTSPGPSEAPLSTVMSWQTYGPIVHDGLRYGVKADSFESFLELPRLREEPFEIALGGANAPRDRLRANGWRILERPPGSLDDYQQYLAGSRAEFGIAKEGYVKSNCGWFSERSAAYLASGRPVVVQSTGFEEWLPSGAGVLPFTTAADAAVALDDLTVNYRAHCRDARELVDSYFRYDHVLEQLIERAFTTPS